MDIKQSDYRKTESQETLQAFSPITYLQKDGGKIPPMFIARAGRDEVPTMDDSIDRFVSAALAKNISLTFMNHPQGVSTDSTIKTMMTDRVRSSAVQLLSCGFI